MSGARVRYFPEAVWELEEAFERYLERSPRAAEAFLRAVTIPIVAPSLGGVETLAVRPAITSHAGLSAEEREKIGIRDGLVRISVGIEAKEDLIDDFRQALQGLGT